jgi:hypothetical protein
MQAHPVARVKPFKLRFRAVCFDVWPERLNRFLVGDEEGEAEQTWLRASHEKPPVAGTMLQIYTTNWRQQQRYIYRKQFARSGGYTLQ